ncbi:hypothetical protein TNCV_2818871 [Trichonephila clavipes]|nr:hypothetical protein TNCV_2818871 [Trichonephila clavipes]
MIGLTELGYEKRETTYSLIFRQLYCAQKRTTFIKCETSIFPSKLQPLDQGIIHNFKTFYRSEVVKGVLDSLENQQNVTTISLLTALIIIEEAWIAVTPLTIHSCFKKSGFPSPNLVDVDDTLTQFKS